MRGCELGSRKFLSDDEEIICDQFRPFCTIDFYIIDVNIPLGRSVSNPPTTPGTDSMFMVTKREWDALNGATFPISPAIIPAGRYEIERIPNPAGHPDHWLVLKGTLIGASEGSWRQWENGRLADDPSHPNYGKPVDWGEFQIVIEE